MATNKKSKHVQKFREGSCVVYKCRKPEGGFYYTVVNKDNDKHRHWNNIGDAVELAYVAGRQIIPKDADIAIKKDAYFLLDWKMPKKLEYTQMCKGNHRKGRL